MKEKGNVVNDDEKIYAKAEFMSTNDCAGICVLLKRLNGIKHLNNRVRQLLEVSLKLFSLTLKIQLNCSILINGKFNAISTLLRIGNLFINEGIPVHESQQFEQIVDLLDVLLIEASHLNPLAWDEFIHTSGGTAEDIRLLFSTVYDFKKTSTTSPSTSSASAPATAGASLPAAFVKKVLRVCAFLATGNEAKMKVLLNSYMNIANFNQIDNAEVTKQNVHIFETNISLFSSIHNSLNGNRFKDWLLKENIVQNMIQYLLDILRYFHYISCLYVNMFRLNKDFYENNLKMIENGLETENI